jgi:hypothetical protein
MTGSRYFHWNWRGRAHALQHYWNAIADGESEARRVAYQFPRRAVIFQLRMQRASWGSLTSVTGIGYADSHSKQEGRLGIP